jgi:hypothetical protein
MRGLFSDSQQPPHPPDHHHQRGNSIGPLFEYNSIRVVIEMTPART